MTETVIVTIKNTATVTVELILKARGTDKMSSKWVIGCLGTLIALLMVFDGLNRFLIYPWSR